MDLQSVVVFDSPGVWASVGDVGKGFAALLVQSVF